MKLLMKKGKNSRLLRRIWSARNIYLVLLPSLIWYLLFAYYPMYGLTLAFKDFKASKGILGSPWTGFDNFYYVFRDPRFFKSIQTTLHISFGRLLFSFPFPILLAIAINEVRVRRYKKILHTIYTFPHFLSWVLVASIIFNFLSLDGFVNSMISLFSGDPISFMGNPGLFRPMVYISEIWKSSGWSSIIYLAAITSIDVEQYEASEIDGASRIQKIRHITIPNIASTIAVMFILACGRIMSQGFDQIFNLSTAATKSVSETLDMYIYSITFQGPVDFPFSTTVSLFRSVVNLILLVISDRVLILTSGQGLFGSKEDMN
jgi:putative aldouronate transport system permease protein